jgi:hypothetical protein
MDIIRNLDAAVGANLISNTTNGTPGITFSSSTTDGVVLSVSRVTIGNMTGGLMAFATSGASIPVFEFQGAALTSCSTIKFTTGAVAGTYAIRVTNADGTAVGWIPVLTDGSVTAAAL